MITEKIMTKLKQLFSQERGLLTKVAAALGITHSAVSHWHQVPPNRVLEVERMTGISRYVLRPDIYGPAPSDPKVSDAA
jgi:DNA-binding transcriptional regulator YdaS (Cro superfamily)